MRKNRYLKRSNNPFLESLIGGIGGGVGFGTALTLTRGMLDKKTSKRNPVSKVTTTHMDPQEVISYLTYSGFQLEGDYPTMSSAKMVASRQEGLGYDTKIVSVKDVKRPNWVLKRRRGLYSK